MKIRKGDNVSVITGKDLGKSGVIERVFPQENKIVVKGVAIAKKHVKPSKRNPQGGIIEINQKINASNVAPICPNCGKISRIGYEVKNGVKIRVCKKCKQSIESEK